MHLLTRAELSTTDDDLRDAVACAERAVFELPEDATVLSDAALVFRIHAETVADSDRASMAVEYAERALARAEAAGLDPGQFLANLAQCLFVDGQPGPARRMAERALHAVDTSSSTYSAVAAILARIVDGTKPPGDSDALWRSVTDSVATPLPLRAQAWTMRASSAARQQDWETATAHYEAAIADMAQLASDRIDPRSRLDRLLNHTDTPSDAAAAALQLDDSARALTLLEHGRSLVLGTGIDSRGDTVRLSATHPDHARRLAALALARRTL